MTEVNPNHPVTQELHDLWHKVAALLMLKYGVTDALFSADDIEALGAKNLAVVAGPTRGGTVLRVRLMPMAEAYEIAKKEGGGPV